VFRQVLPAALPGIITGIILSVSRAMGETAPLITIGAVSVIRQVPDGLDSKFTVLPMQIYDWSTRPQAGFHDAAAAAIIVLVGMLLLLNSAAIVIRARSQKKV
jgi:phosphate transport system permease protein